MYFEEALLTFDKNNFPSILINRAIDDLIKNQIPFKLKNMVSINQEEIESHLQNIKININQQEQKVQKNQKNIEPIQTKILKILFYNKNFLAISASKDGFFSGTAESLSQISTTIDEYLCYNGQLKLYLSQINIKERLLELEQKANLNLIKCESLNEILKRNFNLDNFDSINAWHSKSNVISKFHYDYYENFLSVFKGKKEIFLSPYSAGIIKSDIYGENSINQANNIDLKKSGITTFTKFRKIKKICFAKKINFLKTSIYEILYSLEDSIENILLKLTELKNLIERYSKLIRIKIGNEFLIKTNISENETLYIPEGYWHKVHTKGKDNLAFNFWWNNFNKILKLDKEIFTIKSGLYCLVDKFICSKGKLLIAEKIELLVKFKDLVENDFEKELVYFLFRHKFDLDKFVLLYFSFDNFEKNDFLGNLFFGDWNALIAKFWGILAKHNKEHLMFKKFRIMRKFITKRIIKNYIL